MTRWLALCLVVYVPHLLEEALTRMHDEPIIVAAFEPLSALSARHAAYLVFQAMLASSLATTLLFGLRGRPRLALMACLALALVCESHHALRALVTLHYNSGFVTSLPMPLVGFALARAIARAWPRSLATTPPRTNDLAS